MSLASVAAGGGIQYAAARLNEGVPFGQVIHDLEYRYPEESRVTIQAVATRALQGIDIAAQLSPLSGYEKIPLGQIPRLLPAGEGILYTLVASLRNVQTGTVSQRTFQIGSPVSLSYPALVDLMQAISDTLYTGFYISRTGPGPGLQPVVLSIDVYSVLRG